MFGATPPSNSTIGTLTAIRKCLYKCIHTKRIYTEQPTSITELRKLVKYAKKHKMKILVSSGGHSSIIMRAFPYINRDNLLVINMQKFRGIKQSRNKSRCTIKSGAIVEDIKKFNMDRSTDFCLHGDCDTVGMGFWLNGLSGVSGIPSTFFRFGSGSDHIKKLGLLIVLVYIEV